MPSGARMGVRSIAAYACSLIRNMATEAIPKWKSVITHFTTCKVHPSEWRLRSHALHMPRTCARPKQRSLEAMLLAFLFADFFFSFAHVGRIRVM